MMEKFRDATFLSRICNRDYESKLVAGGDRITIRQRPNATTFKYRKGMIMPRQGYDTKSKTFYINRANAWRFNVNDIDKKLSDLDNWVGEWTDEFAKEESEVVEIEFLADIYSKCHALNRGLTAGAKGGEYDLGVTGTPLQIYKATQTAAHKSSMIDAVASAAACLEEQPGGMGDSPWILIPVWASLMIQTGELKEASLSGDDVSLLRKGVRVLGSIAGFDVFTSNLLNTVTDTVKCWNCIFGDKKAITYADQVEKTEIKPDPDDFGMIHQSVHVYDWDAIQTTRFGHLYIRKGA